MDNLYLIAGLGNPGRKYEHTRHNVGFDVLDILYDRTENPSPEKFVKSSARRGLLDGKRVMLLKPLTYMNLSGEAVREAADYYRIDTTQMLIVICDDINLPAGTIRIREKGSDGGHNGLKDIIRHLGHDRFLRVRVGVGDRKDRREDLADHVLGHFAGQEKEEMDGAMERAAQAVRCILTEGAARAMSMYNTKPKRDKREEEKTEAESAQK